MCLVRVYYHAGKRENCILCRMKGRDMEQVQNQVHLRLLQVMTQKEISSVEMAARIGISPRAVRQFVNGEKIPSLSRLYTMAHALGVSVKDLLVD